MARLEPALSNAVSACREALQITQQQLAVAAGVSRQTIISIERGDYSPSTVLALRLSLLLAVPVEQLFRLPESEMETLTEQRKRLLGSIGEGKKGDLE